MAQVRRILEKAKGAFAYNTGIVGGAYLIANVIHYLHQLSVSDFLSTSDYGAFSSLVGLLTFLAIPAWSLQIAITKFVARTAAESNVETRDGSTLRASLITGILLGTALALLIGLFLPVIQSVLKIESLAWMLIVEGSIPLYFIVGSLWGFIQGSQRFIGYSVTFIGFAVGRFGMGYLFVWGNLGVGGGVAGTTSGLLLAGLIALFLIRREARLLTTGNPIPAALKPIIKDSLNFSIVGLALSVPTIFDLVLVKALYSSVEAGNFAVAAVLGKMVLFPAIAVPIVLIPETVRRQARHQDSWDLLNLALGLTLLLSGIMAVGMWLYPEMMVRIFFSDQYLDAVPLVRWYGLLMLPFALIFMFTRYCQALGNNWFLWLVTAGTVVQVVAILTVRQGPITIPITVAAVSAAILIPSYIHTFQSRNIRVAHPDFVVQASRKEI